MKYKITNNLGMLVSFGTKGGKFVVLKPGESVLLEDEPVGVNDLKVEKISKNKKQG